MEHETVGGAVVAGVQPFRQGSDVDALVVKLLNGLQSLSEVPRQAVNPRACGKRTGCTWTTWARTTFYGLLASLRGRLFRDADFAGFYCADNSPFTLEPRYLLISLGLGPFFGGRLFHCRQSTRGLACASGSASRRCKLAMSAAEIEGDT